MFQSHNERKRHDDQPICIGCVHDANCEHKPVDWPKPSWRYVLAFCAKFEPRLIQGGKKS